jgi:glyoxylase-like metal-dependent hydrolase (beta-lactamase superfamily II)
MIELREIAPHVYAALVPDRGWSWSNAGFVARGDGLMVDTFMDVRRTREALALLADAGGRKPTRLVNTHHNVDHCWGNQLFRDREIIAHRRAAELMAKDLRPELLAALVEAKEASPGLAWFANDLRGHFDFSEVEVTLPNRLIDGDVELEIGGTLARLLSVGPAHTAGDVLVHLPDDDVVFAGDVIFRGCTPLGWEGTFAGWIAALERILKLSPAVIVPGHGPLCGPEGASELIDYFRYVFSEAKRCFERELSLEDAAASIELGPYGRWNQPERLVFSLARAYRELAGGSPDESLPAAELLDLAVKVRPRLRR